MRDEQTLEEWDEEHFKIKRFFTTLNKCKTLREQDRMAQVLMGVMKNEV